MGARKSFQLSSMLVYSAIAVVIIVCFWFIFRTNPIAVERGHVVKGLFEEKFFIDGKTRARDKITVVAFASGDIDEIKLRKGDLIKKGDFITTLHWDYHKKILSPMTGVISNLIRAYPGPINRGDALLEIVDLNSLEIVIEPLTSSAMRIQPEAPVEILGLEGRQTTVGQVSRISRAGFLKMSALGVEEERTEVFIELVSPHQQTLQQLGDGFHVEVAILLSKKDQVLKVPLGALFKIENKWAVYVIQENRTHLRYIEISDKNETEAIVSSGLKEGEEVVLFPSDLISDQTVVR